MKPLQTVALCWEAFGTHDMPGVPTWHGRPPRPDLLNESGDAEHHGCGSLAAVATDIICKYMAYWVATITTRSIYHF